MTWDNHSFTAIVSGAESVVDVEDVEASKGGMGGDFFYIGFWEQMKIKSWVKFRITWRKKEKIDQEKLAKKLANG
jgi:hypothetical protein